MGEQMPAPAVCFLQCALTFSSLSSVSGSPLLGEQQRGPGQQHRESIAAGPCVVACLSLVAASGLPADPRWLCVPHLGDMSMCGTSCIACIGRRLGLAVSCKEWTSCLLCTNCYMCWGVQAGNQPCDVPYTSDGGRERLCSDSGVTQSSTRPAQAQVTVPACTVW